MVDTGGETDMDSNKRGSGVKSTLYVTGTQFHRNRVERTSFLHFRRILKKEIHPAPILPHSWAVVYLVVRQKELEQVALLLATGRSDPGVGRIIWVLGEFPYRT